MPQVVQMELKGVKPFLRRLRRVENARKQRSIIKSGFSASAGPVKTEMRRNIRQQQARRFGYLAKAVYSKVKAYAGGGIILLVGVKDRKVATGQNPGKYFHLVDLGTSPHPMPGMPANIGGIWFMVPGEWMHPGAKAKPIREPALRRSGPKMAERMFDRYEKRLAKELRNR